MRLIDSMAAGYALAAIGSVAHTPASRCGSRPLLARFRICRGRQGIGCELVLASVKWMIVLGVHALERFGRHGRDPPLHTAEPDFVPNGPPESPTSNCTYPRTDRTHAHGCWKTLPDRTINMTSVPTVLFPLTLPKLLEYILATQSGTAPTLLIICASRDNFLRDLQDSLQQDGGEDGAGGLAQLITPTLHNLFITRHIKLAFCASVQTLLAYLTAYRTESRHVGDVGGRERLVLVNVLALHSPTSSFSAQGLSRTFATAAEAAIKRGVMLHVVECQGKNVVSEDHEGEDTDMDDVHEDTLTETKDADPWEQEVSILNVSARRFGSNTGERAWVGRTVKAKRIAGRWFRFHKIDDG